MGLLEKFFPHKILKRGFNKKQNLKSLALKKINKIEKKRFSNERFDEINFIFNVFMAKMFSIKKQKTNEEIILILKEKKIEKSLRNKIITFSSELNEIKYKGIELNHKEFKEIILQFKEIIEII